MHALYNGGASDAEVKVALAIRPQGGSITWRAIRMWIKRGVSGSIGPCRMGAPGSEHGADPNHQKLFYLLVGMGKIPAERNLPFFNQPRDNLLIVPEIADHTDIKVTGKSIKVSWKNSRGS
ncbi:hypothetical protein ACVIGA_000612 [Bradyrhizobium sp. USDA 3240]